MPTYDYECQDCGHRFEMFQSITAKPHSKCPECAGKVNRLLGTGAGLIFKGSGFYQTDYRSSDYKKAAEAEKPAAKTDSTNTDSAKTDSTKADAKTSSGGEAPKDSASKPGKKTRDKGESSAA